MSETTVGENRELDLTKALYEKMVDEQAKYRDWLKSQSPEEILCHAFEYTIREDIVMAMDEYVELTDAQAQALLDLPTPLAEVFRYFEKVETDHMTVIQDCIEIRANDEIREQNEKIQLEKAKRLITDFCMQEYESAPDFTNMGEISIAYTTITDEEIPIQVYVDLVHFRLNTYLDGELVGSKEYDSLEEFVEEELADLDFDDLTYVPDEALENCKKANNELAANPPYVKVYNNTFAYASEHKEVEWYRASFYANIKCKEAIEAAIREHFDGYHLNDIAVNSVIQVFGVDRVKFVLANTVNLADWDGRYSVRNKEWANTVSDYNSESNRLRYRVTSHPAVLNGYIDQVRNNY